MASYGRATKRLFGIAEKLKAQRQAIKEAEARIAEKRLLLEEMKKRR